MATIRDIAKKAGVSPGAVSRILNNDTTLHVSAETRKKVLNTAKNLNYKKVFESKYPRRKKHIYNGYSFMVFSRRRIKRQLLSQSKTGCRRFLWKII